MLSQTNKATYVMCLKSAFNQKIVFIQKSKKYHFTLNNKTQYLHLKTRFGRLVLTYTFHFLRKDDLCIKLYTQACQARVSGDNQLSKASLCVVQDFYCFLSIIIVAVTRRCGRQCSYVPDNETIIQCNKRCVRIK